MQLHPLLLIRDSVSANNKNATLCHCKITISTIKIGHEVKIIHKTIYASKVIIVLGIQVNISV